jgi:hypothetical protein
MSASERESERSARDNDDLRSIQAVGGPAAQSTEGTRHLRFDQQRFQTSKTELQKRGVGLQPVSNIIFRPDPPYPKPGPAVGVAMPLIHRALITQNESLSMKNIAKAERQKSAAAISSRRPFRSSGKVPHNLQAGQKADQSAASRP